MPSEQVIFSALKGIARIKSGDCIATAIVRSLQDSRISPRRGDIVVVCQKIVSKSEGRSVSLRSVTPSAFAETVAKEVDKDPRLVEVILGQTRRVVRMEKPAPGKGRIIAETHSGTVMANAGVDLSNTGAEDTATLLPVNPDLSAERIARKLLRKTGEEVAVIISDTVGRPWRQGLVDIAIGCSGIKALADRRGEKDMCGFELTATEMAVADQIAAAAGILMGKDSGFPVVLARGLEFNPACEGAGELLRPPSEDLFR